MSLDSWILINAHPERDRRALNALINAFGDADSILGASASSLSRIPGVAANFAKALLNQPRQFQLQREKDMIERYGIRLIPVNHEDYPLNLKTMSAPPPLLYVKGTLIPEDRYCIGVVGSRNNSSCGRRICEEIAGELARKGVTIASGMARGVDSLAHLFAIKNGGRTLAALGNGLSVCYPPENENLMEEIASHGALLSEYPMSTPPRKKHFPERNGVIAGLSLGVLVVEAHQRSGSLITARAALDENRSVYAVPGDIFKESFKGNNDLIRQGAQIVRTADDILEDLSLVIHGMMREN